MNVTTASVQLRLNVMWLGVFGIYAWKEQNLAKRFRVLVKICSYSTAFFKTLEKSIARYVLIFYREGYNFLTATKLALRAGFMQTFICWHES